VNCQETCELIHAYADGELDLVKNLDIDQHLRDCPACARTHAEIQEVRRAIQAGSLYFPAPPELQARIRSSLPTVRRATATRHSFAGRWLALAASLALFAAGGWTLGRFGAPSRGEGLVEQQLVDSHIRSQMLPGHALDVESSDRHTVRPWFEHGGKLDFSPPVPDLKVQELALIGGRLDYLDNRPVAVLVYKLRKHLINLFIWRSDVATDTPIETRTQQSYHLATWKRGGLTYWAVSSVSADELGNFARLVRDGVR
jgi:anti-sigma factor RsiW